MDVDLTKQVGPLEAYGKNIEEKFPVLGRLMWYSISEVVITEDDLRALVQKVGLSEAYLPPKIQGNDAFRKAAAAVKRKTNASGMEERWFVEEVACEDHEIVDHIVRQEVDSKGRKLNWESLGEVTYLRPTDVHPRGRIQVMNEAPYHLQDQVDMVEDMGREVTALFEDYSQFFHGNAVRSMVTRILKSCSTITVRSSGGVYFAPESYRGEVAKVDALFKQLGGGCQFHYLPLIDDSDQRKMLVAAFEDQAVVGVERTLDDIATILKSGKTITGDRYAKFVDEYHSLKAKAREYSDLLDEQMVRAGDSLTIFDQQIAALLDRVKATS